MDFSLPDDVEAFRSEVRQLIAEHFSVEEQHRIHETGTYNCPPLYRALGDRGFIERAIPGLGKGDPLELWALFNELEKADAPYAALSVIIIVAGIVSHVGSREQKERILPSLVSGRSMACLGYSEADSGSDLASITTRAVRDGESWIINGAKMWTTMAHEADWLVLLTRTDPSLPPHRGLTMFLLPMDTPGITVQPVYTMGDERTNATFYDDVRAGPGDVLGEVNGGWNVLTVGLSFERGVVGDTNAGVSLLRRFHEWTSEAGLIARPQLRQLMARVAIDNEVAKLLTQRSAWLAATGRLPAVEGSMSKLFATKAYQDAVRRFHEATGPEGLLAFGVPDAAADGWIDHLSRNAPVCTIRGGTTEINRNMVAERHFGFPKAR
jgi:alkylation response protein AidB-like acyl-CoA dehydrogenase